MRRQMRERERYIQHNLPGPQLYPHMLSFVTPILIQTQVQLP